MYCVTQGHNITGPTFTVAVQNIYSDLYNAYGVDVF